MFKDRLNKQIQKQDSNIIFHISTKLLVKISISGNILNFCYTLLIFML